MLTKEQFIKVVNAVQQANTFTDALRDLNIDLLDTTIMLSFDQVISVILDSNFPEDIVDLIYWWLYEYEDKTQDAMWDADENVIPMHTADDLWNYCKDYLR